MKFSHVRNIANRTIIAAAIAVQVTCLLFVPNSEAVIYGAMFVGIGSILITRPASRSNEG